jgi:hypothetical protein
VIQHLLHQSLIRYRKQSDQQRPDLAIAVGKRRGSIPFQFNLYAGDGTEMSF